MHQKPMAILVISALVAETSEKKTTLKKNLCFQYLI